MTHAIQTFLNDSNEILGVSEDAVKVPWCLNSKTFKCRLHITCVNCTTSPGNGISPSYHHAARAVLIPLPLVLTPSILGHTDTEINTASRQWMSPVDFTKWKMKSDSSRHTFSLKGLVFFKFCFSSSNISTIHHLLKFKPDVDFWKPFPASCGTQMAVGPLPSILVNVSTHQTFPHH